MHKTFAAILLVTLCGCSSMHYDLDGVPFPVLASTSGDDGEPFELDSKYVMYCHGLLGEKQPKVKQLLLEHCRGASSVTDFRVSGGANLWDWLGTHLSLGLVRIKTVTIRGRLHRAPAKPTK